MCSAAPFGSATAAPRRCATSSRSSISALLVGKVWIVEPGYRFLIGAAQEHTTQLLARGFDPPRKEQRRVTQVDEGDLAALLNPPAMAQSGRETPSVFANSIWRSSTTDPEPRRVM